jgi:hypothetical protein
MFQRFIFPGHDAVDPMPGKLPYGNSALVPNRT